MFVDMAYVCFAWIIAHVLRSWLVLHVYIPLCSLVVKQEILHFRRIGSLSFDCIIYDAQTCSVFDVYRFSRWWMYHLVQN